MSQQHAVATDGGPAADDQLDAQGWNVRPLLAEHELAELRSLAAEVAPPDTLGFFASHAHLPPEPRRIVDRRVRTVVEGRLAEAVHGSRVVAAALLSKPARSGSALPFHPDLSYTEEPSRRSYVAWVPLVDTGPSTGGMRVIPGSHRWSDKLRAGGPHGMPTGDLQAELAPLAVDVMVPAGHVLLWDSALIHGSHPNPSGVARPVATCALLRDDGPLRYVHRHPDGRLEGFTVDEEFFFSAKPFQDRPAGYPAHEVWAELLEPEDLLPHLQPRPQEPHARP